MSEKPDEKDGDGQKAAKAAPEKKGDPLKDNEPKDGSPKDGDPKSGEKAKEKSAPTGAQPPTSEKAPPADPDMKGVFSARLPDKVREAVLNGDFDQVPEKYRALVAEWTRLLAEKDRAEAEKK